MGVSNFLYWARLHRKWHAACWQPDSICAAYLYRCWIGKLVFASIGADFCLRTCYIADQNKICLTTRRQDEFQDWRSRHHLAA